MILRPAILLDRHRRWLQRLADQGDTVSRRLEMKSNHVGNHWVGIFERRDDRGTHVENVRRE
jgi:hypothetical protein